MLAPFGLRCFPIIPANVIQDIPGVSCTRKEIVDYLWECEISRPLHYIERKNGSWKRRGELLTNNGGDSLILIENM